MNIKKISLQGVLGFSSVLLAGNLPIPENLKIILLCIVSAITSIIAAIQDCRKKLDILKNDR